MGTVFRGRCVHHRANMSAIAAAAASAPAASTCCVSRWNERGQVDGWRPAEGPQQAGSQESGAAKLIRMQQTVAEARGAVMSEQLFYGLHPAGCDLHSLPEAITWLF